LAEQQPQGQTEARAKHASGKAKWLSIFVFHRDILAPVSRSGSTDLLSGSVRRVFRGGMTRIRFLSTSIR
jgi:hypothetical protein